jgi:MFS superfamily sulfate permease-like transporter
VSTKALVNPPGAVRTDIIAGLSVAALMLPEAVAYSGIAGLPPAHAILAGIAGCLVYSLTGRSRFAILSPTSSSAAILAATLATLPQIEGDRVALTMVAVAMAGGLFLAASILRLGALTSFIAHPVLRGFAFGLALTIMIKQLPTMVGIAAPGTDVFRTAWTVFANMPHWHWPSVIIGAVALTALIGLRRVPLWPGALLVLVAGIAASAWFDLQTRGVATVGRIVFDLGLPPFASFSVDTLFRIAPLAAPLALILLAESWGTTRALALRHGDMIEANRELRALGLANIGAALFQGMPVGAGLSATSANEAAGARTRLAGAIAAIALGVLVLAAMPLIALLPQPVLAAVVIAALTHALDPRPLIRLWSLDRDKIVGLAAAGAVLLLGVLNGMLFAILLSLAALIQRFSTARFLRLGQLGDSHDYVDIARHPEAKAPAGIAIWRPAVPLFFANAEPLLEAVLDEARRKSALRGAIVSLEESADLDSTAFDALVAFDAQMTRLAIAPHYARVHDEVRDLLSVGGASSIIARSHYSVADAVAAIRKEF